MRTAWNLLFRLYPCDYRIWFGAEMRSAFEQRADERRHRGRAALLVFASAELACLASQAVAEWAALLLTDSSVRARSLPDLRRMRPAGVSREVHFADACIRAWNRSLTE